MKPYPVRRTYDSLEAAVAGAALRPLQAKAKRDGTALSAAKIAEAYWSDDTFAVKFSNGLWLHVCAFEHDVAWWVTNRPPDFGGIKFETVGAPPVLIRWGGEVGDHPMDRSALLEKRLGAECSGLWVNEFGLLLYSRDNPILSFSVVARTDVSEDILYVGDFD